ncbi:MAG: hypothetical protein AABW50_00630 [Nanoarchaeota archaeon]
MEQIIHYPNLKTVLMVETVLREAEKMMTREEIKEKLPKQIMHQTLNIILDYLEKRGMIIDSHKGILWIYNPNPRLRKAIEKGREIKFLDININK